MSKYSRSYRQRSRAHPYVNDSFRHHRHPVHHWNPSEFVRAAAYNSYTYCKHPPASRNLSLGTPISFKDHKDTQPSENTPTIVFASPEEIKEWDNARCPICRDHPHNAVLLKCSSQSQGCRTFICDTSHRHSNCLDQYRKTFSGYSPPKELLCPMCRGKISEWKVLEAARAYMNAKVRICALEACEFKGSYQDLREHARKRHHYQRPCEPDPIRKYIWHKKMERWDWEDALIAVWSDREDEWNDTSSYENGEPLNAFGGDDEEVSNASAEDDW